MAKRRMKKPRRRIARKKLVQVLSKLDRKRLDQYTKDLHEGKYYTTAAQRRIQKAMHKVMGLIREDEKK